jgi:hypothetical protein
MITTYMNRVKNPYILAKWPQNMLLVLPGCKLEAEESTKPKRRHKTPGYTEDVLL